MSTTTIRLPEDLKARVAAAAEELRADFDAVAEERYAGIAAAGKTIPWQEMRAYLEERLAGKAAMRPAARKLAR
jgi:predicted transcriptional regulator